MFSQVAEIALRQFQRDHVLLLHRIPAELYSPALIEMRKRFPSAESQLDFLELLKMGREETLDLKYDLIKMDQVIVYNFDLRGSGVNFYNATDKMSMLRAATDMNSNLHLLRVSRPEANLEYWKQLSDPSMTNADRPVYTYNHPLGNWGVWLDISKELARIRRDGAA